MYHGIDSVICYQVTLQSELRKKAMAYTYTNSKGTTYYLHTKEVKLRGDRLQRIYYFAKEQKEGVVDELPEGYMIEENKRTGLPILKKKKAEGEEKPAEKSE